MLLMDQLWPPETGQTGGLFNSDQGSDKGSAENLCSRGTAETRGWGRGSSPAEAEMACLQLEM